MFSIKDLTRKRIRPRIPFSKIADKVLGKNYDLSLVFCGDHLSRRLNREFRQRDYPTNVLSFPIDKQAGEIFLNLAKATRESRAQGENFDLWVAYLFIHGLLHLKGFDHSSRMENEEQKIISAFGLNAKKHRHRS
jgi:probable rRNA maturation factor